MATQKVVVEGSSVTAPQLSDFFRQIGDGSLSGYHLQALLDHRNPFEIPMDTDSQVDRWRKVCEREFNITILDEIVIPERKPGFDRLIVVPEGLTLNQIIKVFRTKFKVWTYVDDLDRPITKNERTNEATYAIWVREQV